MVEFSAPKVHCDLLDATKIFALPFRADVLHRGSVVEMEVDQGCLNWLGFLVDLFAYKKDLRVATSIFLSLSVRVIRAVTFVSRPERELDVGFGATEQVSIYAFPDLERQLQELAFPHGGAGRHGEQRNDVGMTVKCSTTKKKCCRGYYSSGGKSGA